MNTRRFLLYFVIAISCLTSGCSATQEQIPTLPVPTQISTATSEPTLTPTRLPTLAPTPTKTVTPTEIPTPTQTPQPQVIEGNTAAKLSLAHRLGEGEVVQALFSPDGKRLAVATTVNIHLLDPLTMEPLWSAVTGSALVEISFSEDGMELLGVSSGGDVFAWKSETGEFIGTFLEAETGVSVVHLSNSGDHLLTVTDTDSVAIFGTRTGEELRRLEQASSYNVWNAQIKPDGSAFMITGIKTASWWQRTLQMQLWDTTNGKFLLAMRGADSMSGYIGRNHFSKDGKFYGVCGYDSRGTGSIQTELFVWDAESGKLLMALKVNGEISAFDFLAQEKVVLVGSRDGTLKSYEIKEDSTQNPFTDDSKASVTSLDISPDGQWMAVARIDGQVEIWDIANRKVIQTAQLDLSRKIVPYYYVYDRDVTYHEQTVAVAFDPQNQRIAITNPDQGAIQIITIAGETLKTLESVGKGTFSAAVFAPDGKTLAAVFDQKEIVVWDVESGNQLRTISTSHKNQIFNLKYSPDGKTLASISIEQIFLWDPTTGEQGYALYGYSAMDFAPGGGLLASDNVDLGLYFWDLDTGKYIKSLPAHYIYGLSYSPDGKTLAVADLEVSQAGKERNRVVRLLDVEKYEWLPTAFEAHLQMPDTVTYSPDGKILVVGDIKGNLYLWDVTSGSLLRRLNGVGPTPMNLFFTSDQRTLIVGTNDGVLRFFEVEP